MVNNIDNKDPLKHIWSFFASIKLSIAILLILASTSIIGTFIPQNQDPLNYIQNYGRFLFNIFNALSLFDMYHSWWFRYLLLILALNIVVCSIERLTATWKIIFPQNNNQLKLSKFANAFAKETFIINNSKDKLKENYLSIISSYSSKQHLEENENGFYIFFEKYRWSRLGVYIVHFGVLVLLLGALTGSIFGFSGYVNIPQNESIKSIKLRNSNATYELGFTVRCDDFKVTFYDSGAPKEFRSTISLLNENNLILTKDIIVNDPLSYKGISFYQSNYGTLSPKEITLNFLSKETSISYPIKTSIGGQLINIPEGKGTFTIDDFIADFSYKGHDIGEVLIGTLKEGNNKQPAEIILPMRHPHFDKMRGGNFIISVADVKRTYYTGLQVVKDPGVYIVYIGFIIMISGFFVAFFIFHQSVLIEVVEQSNQSSQIIVSGISNKNKIGMQNKIKRIAKNLKNIK